MKQGLHAVTTAHSRLTYQQESSVLITEARQLATAQCSLRTQRAHVVAPVVEPGQRPQRAVVGAAVAGQGRRDAALAGVPAQGCDSTVCWKSVTNQA